MNFRLFGFNSKSCVPRIDGNDDILVVDDRVFTNEDIFKELIRCFNLDVIHSVGLRKNTNGVVRSVLYNRTLAIIHAYNPNMEKDDMLMQWFCSGSLLDRSCSQEKLDCLLNITNMDFKDVRRRNGFFMGLLQYYLSTDIITHAYDGLIECSNGFYQGIKYSKEINKEINSIIETKVLNVLQSLLGDKYDRTFTKRELCENFEFPSYTEDEIERMIRAEKDID